MAWQPIETAPKDGRRILVLTVHDEVELSEWLQEPSVNFELTENGLYRKVIGRGYEGWNSSMPVLWCEIPELPAGWPDSMSDNAGQGGSESDG